MPGVDDVAPPVRRMRGPDKQPRKRRNATPGPPRLPTVGVSDAVLASRRRTQEQRAVAVGKELPVADPNSAPESIPEDETAYDDDLAAVVVAKTRRLLAAGKVTPTLRDGLSAQQLLDRRAEKAADRQFMLNLAVAMAGGGNQAPEKYLPTGEEPKNVTEGDYTDMDLAPAHLRRA